MSYQRILGRWDFNIPIEFDRDKLDIVSAPCKHFLSVDGNQYAEMVRKNRQDVISIYSESILIKQINPPVSIARYHTWQIYFSSEYLLYIRISGDQYNGMIDVFIHNFIQNKEKSFVFRNTQFRKYFYSEQVFYLLLELEESYCFQLCRIDENFQIQKLNQINSKYIHLLTQNNLGFFMKESKKVFFISKFTLKTFLLFISDSVSKYFCSDFFAEDFLSKLFFIESVDWKYNFVVSIHNRKIIRKLDYERFNRNSKISKCIYKHYLISYQNGTIFVHDLMKGELVGVKNFTGYKGICDVSVRDGHLVFKDYYNSYFGWKLKKD